MCMMAWELALNVLGHYNMLPVWIDLPFCAIALETLQKIMAESLGRVIVYHQGKEYKYPNDRVYMLWDITKPPPQCLKVKISLDIHIW